MNGKSAWTVETLPSLHDEFSLANLVPIKYRHTLAKSQEWLGAYSLVFDCKFANIYIGDG